MKNRYLLQDLLGEGGMGRVYRAVDSRTREAVAVKVLSESARRDPKVLRSLWREVRAVARMLHPNIVQVYDYGQTADDSPFLVMEYVPGRGLDAWRGRLAVRDLLETVDGVLAALAYAHARGVVHRDLKPENVLVVEGRDGSLQPKLVDFGVAQVGGLQTDRGRSQPGHAIANLIVGTPAYMSPEQAQGNTRDVGPESDLYALGVMLYEFVSGALPFESENTMGMLFQHVSSPPPPLFPPVGVVLPDGLDAIVMRLLEKRPERRFMFAADLRRALRRLDWSQANDGLIGTSDERSAVRELPRQTQLAAPPTSTEPFAASPAETQRRSEDASDLLRTVFSGHGDSDEAAASHAPAAPGLFGLREVPLVGREGERTTLWSTFERVLRERSACAVVLHGPAGVGTSRLARWVSEKAEEEGLARSLGHGVGAGTVLPAGGLRGLLERQLRLQGLDRKHCASVLQAQLVKGGDFDDHEVAPLLAFLRPTQEAAAAALDPVAILGRALRAATRRRPVILWLDDVDGPEAGPALDLLEFLLATRNLAPLPVFAVLTVNSESTSPASARLREVADDEGVLWCDVAPLSVDAMARLVSDLLPVGARLAQTVAERSNGNPAVALQILSLWLEQGQLVEEDGGRLGLVEESMSIRRLPAQLGDLMRSRLGTVLSQCPDAGRAREILTRAAVTGRRFHLALLEEAFAREGRGDLAADLDVVWDRMVENDFWLEVDTGVAQFSRAEVLDLVSDHLVDDAEAMRFRAIVAETMLDLFADRVAELHAELASHLAASGQYDRACDHELLAGQQALAWAQFALAREAFVRAQELLRLHPLRDAMRVADGVDLGLASWALRTGAYDEAEHRLDSVSGRMLGKARQSALAQAALLRAELTHKRGNLEQATVRYHDACELFTDLGDARGLARALQGLAYVLLNRGHYDAARDAAARARTLNETLDDPLSTAHCLIIEGKVARLQVRYDEAEERLAAAAEMSERAGDAHGVAQAMMGLADLRMLRGNLEQARSGLVEARDRFVVLGDPSAVAQARRGLGRLNHWLGELDLAIVEYRGALQLSRDLGDRLSEARALNGLGEVARKQADWDAAVGYYDAYIQTATAMGAEASCAIGWANIGLTHAERGHWDAAVHAFEQAVGIARRIGSQEYLCAFLGTLAHAQAELGAWASAGASADEALRIDALVRSTQPDFLNALERFAVLAADALPQLSGAALSLVAERWTLLGEQEQADRVRGRLASVRP